jgi:hypothetical protein
MPTCLVQSAGFEMKEMDKFCCFTRPIRLVHETLFWSHSGLCGRFPVLKTKPGRGWRFCRERGAPVLQEQEH